MVNTPRGVINGMDNADVDWFLRDSDVSPLDHSSSTNSRINSEIVSSQRDNSPPNSVLHSKSPPMLHILNMHDTSMNKSKPSDPSVLNYEAHLDAIKEFCAQSTSPKLRNRRDSASSIGSFSSIDSSSSTNGFFSKIKSRLQRSNSNGANSAHTLGSKEHSSDTLRQYPSAGKNAPKGSPEMIEKPSIDAINEDSSDYGDINNPRLCRYIQFFKQGDTSKTCLKKQPMRVDDPTLSSSNAEVPSQPSRISSLLRKMSISSQSVKPHEDSVSTSAPVDTNLRLEDEICKTESLSLMKPVKPLKHVAFHSQTFLIDPPQQIPSRNPRKGNVEILASGVVRVNPLTEEDKKAIEMSLKGQGGGLVVGGTGVLGFLNKDDELSSLSSNELTKICLEGNPIALDETSDIENSIQPMKKTGYSAPVKKMALDLMYTRCCHLREILPVPAILKQIPPGSTAPLPLLQLRNPTPTNIEILTFADFIRIAPIICISLDGISLSIEQFTILLSAMCAKTQLEKLSLRNTPIDAEGWTQLCWFLSRNKVINRLDVTQCPPLSLNLLRKKKKCNSDEQNITRMVCNHENRSDMDWTMFTAALIARGGIEELILTGCCISDLAIFETLMKKAVPIKTFKLGLAYNLLSPQQLAVVLENWLFSEKCMGLDLGYNDFLSAQYLQTFLSFGHRKDFEKSIRNSQIRFLSLNATNLRFNETFMEFLEKFVVQLPNLKYLDISNNPKLFENVTRADMILNGDCRTYNTTEEKDNDVTESPECLNGNMENEHASCTESLNLYFCSQLPRFKSLARLHLENNGLSSSNLKALFEVVPFCKNLNYLSIVGNKLDIYSATSLLQCLRYSTSLITVDADYLDVPEMFKEKVGLYSMRNMDNFFKKSLHEGRNDETGSTEAASSAGSLANELSNLLSRKAVEKLDFQSEEVKAAVRKIQRHRVILQDAFNDLFDLQYKRKLNVDGKEALIRLLFVDSALEWALKLIDSSLVKKDKDLTSSDLINMNSAEDEKSESNAHMMAKAHETILNEHNSLSPVGLSSLPLSRQQSFSNLSSLDKEEGSVLKLLRLKNLNLFQNLSSVSGDEIKERLLNDSISDLETVIEDISNARENGIPMRDIFNDFGEERTSDQRVEESANICEDNKKTAMGDESSASSNPSVAFIDQASASGGGKTLSMNDTYDRILLEFNK